MKKLLLSVSLFVSGSLCCMERQSQQVDNKPASSNNEHVPSLKNLSLHALAEALFSPLSLENVQHFYQMLTDYNIHISPEDSKDIITTHASQFPNQTLPLCCLPELDNEEKRVFSPDGSYIAIRDQYLFDVKEQQLYPLEKAARFGSFHFSPKGTYLYRWMAGDKDKFGIWDTKTKKLLKIFTPAEYRDLGTPLTTPDEHYLIFENPRGGTVMYDLKTFQKVGEMPASFLKEASISPDGLRIAIPITTTIDNLPRTTTHVYQIPSGNLITVLEGGSVVAFSPNGKYIATQAYSAEPTRHSCLRIYQADGYYLGMQQCTRENRSWPVKITFSSDSSKVLTQYFHDGGYTIWDIAQGKMIFQQEKSGYGKENHLSQLLICDDMTKVVEVDNLYRATLTVKTLDGAVLQQMSIKKLQNFQPTHDGKRLLSCEWEGSTLYSLDNLNDRQVITSKYGNVSLSPNDMFAMGNNELLFIGLPRPNTLQELLAIILKKGESATFQHYFPGEAYAKALAIKKVLHDNAITKSRSYDLKKRFIIDDGYTPTVYDTQSNKKLNFAWNIYEKVSKDKSMEEFVEKTWNDAENTCTICLEPNIDQIVECNHVFHKKCLKQWLMTKKSCPICRHELK